jgi:hypothetical protein
MTEDQIQAKIIIHYRNQFKGLIFSVPNGGTRNIIEAKKLKATGLLAGVADLIILKPNAECIFVEVKIEKGAQSDVQKLFEKKVTQMGFKYYLVRSFEEFLKLDL